jgi:hypothetical protein
MAVKAGSRMTARPTTTTSGRNSSGEISKAFRIADIFSDASWSPGSPSAKNTASAIDTDTIDVSSVSRMCWYRSTPAAAAARLAESDSGEDLSPK